MLIHHQTVHTSTILLSEYIKIFLAPRPAMFRLHICISSVLTEPWLGVEFQRTMQ